MYLLKRTAKKNSPNTKRHDNFTLSTSLWHTFANSPEFTHTDTHPSKYTHTKTCWCTHPFVSKDRRSTWAQAHAHESCSFIASSLYSLSYSWLTTHCFAAYTKAVGIWVSTSVLMNLSRGGGARTMFHTKNTPTGPQSQPEANRLTCITSASPQYT